MFKVLISIGIGVWIQFWAVIFAFWYGDLLNDLFCDSSFFGSAECTEPRPFESVLIRGVVIAALLFGSTVPAILFRSRWWQVVLVFVLTPLLTTFVFVVPIVLVAVLIAAQS